MFTEDQLALVNEIVPRTLRSLFVLRITLCVTAFALALVKISLSPPLSSFFLDVFASTPDRSVLTDWTLQLNFLASGLLAGVLALVVATFFIQARIRSQAEEEMNIDAPTGTSIQP